MANEYAYIIFLTAWHILVCFASISYTDTDLSGAPFTNMI